MEKMLETIAALHTHTHTSNLMNNKLQLGNCGLLVKCIYNVLKIIKDSFKTCIEIYEF